MSLPSTPSQSSSKSKRRSKGGNDSPKPDGVRWVPLSGAPHCKVPSHRRSFSAEQERSEYFRGRLDVDNVSLESLSGGVVDTRGPVLYGNWVQLESLKIGDHVPAGKDSILLHPETMRVIAAPIASHLVVRVGWKRAESALEEEIGGESSSRNTAEAGGQQVFPCVCCKVWPCTSLPLDAVALGWSVALGCGIQEGEGLEVWLLDNPVSSIPVAGSVALTSIEGPTLPWNRSFINYLLYSHEGHLITRDSCLGVSSYLGERRVFRVVAITGHQDLTGKSSSSMADVEKSLSKLAVSASSSNGRVPSTCSFSRPIFSVYKITGSTQLTTSTIENSWVQGALEPGRAHGLSGVGGAKEQKELLRKLVLHPLNERLHNEHILFPHGVLLYGPPGVGKSRLAQAVAESTTAHAQTLRARQLLVQDGDVDLCQAFAVARENCPAVIILEDIDMLSPQRDAPASEAQLKVLTRLSNDMDSLLQDQPPKHVVVMATTTQLERVDSSLRVPGRFKKEIEVPVPTASDRLEIFSILLSQRSHELSGDQLKSVADRAHGYVGADLNSVCAEAQYKALGRTLDGEGIGMDRMCREDNSDGPASNVERMDTRKSKPAIITLQDMLSALKEVRPSAMKEVTLEVPKVLWSDVGGNEEVKKSMREAVEWPLRHPEVFERLGILPPRGVLLYGPPGCSKTMVARALATESGLNFMAVKGPELFSKWVGDSEKAVRVIFRRARSAAPAIIFFDEIDALAVQRKGEGSSVGDRVLAQLLTEMDGVESAGDVLVVAATNRPDMIDKALLRPGRIDRLIYVPLPSSSTRKEIFEIQFRRVPVHEDVDLDALVLRTAGYSGAEIVSLCQKAALCAMHEDMEALKVRMDHFSAAFTNVLPQTDQDSLKLYEHFKTKHV